MNNEEIQSGITTTTTTTTAYEKFMYWFLVGGYFVFVLLCIFYSYHLKKNHKREIDEKCGLI